MKSIFIKLHVRFQDLASRERGQDLVEYALVDAMIAFGATGGMRVPALIYAVFGKLVFR